MDHISKEFWRDVMGYEGLYQISNLGRLRSLSRHGSRTEQILKRRIKHHGYDWARLSQNGIAKEFAVHRLVAIAFLDNPLDLPEVNHKDENKLNNRVNNLEWCTRIYNMNYGTARKRMADKNSKAVIQKDLTGKNIKIWHSANEVQKQTGFLNGNISRCCNSKRKTAYGFKWEFAD
jgi:hypothetical protein